MKTLDFRALQNMYRKIKVAKQNSLEDGGWNLGSETEQLLLKKLQSVGIPLVNM